MRWQRLDRENTINVINSVKSAENAGMFSVGTSEVQCAQLPFYKNYQLYKITNYASLPSLTFEFLSDGKFFHYLDATETPIHTVNDTGTLDITEDSVIPYLEFYFSHVDGGEDGDIIIINNPNDMPLLDSLDPEAYHAVFSQHKPAKIEFDGGFNAYEVETDLYINSQLVRAVLEVNVRGRVKIKDQKMIMHEVTRPDFTDTMM